MEIYRTWEDYYQSEQDYYLDEENGADEDVRVRLDDSRVITGMSCEDTYVAYNDGELIGIYVGGSLLVGGSLEDVVDAVGAGVDPEHVYTVLPAYHDLWFGGDRDGEDATVTGVEIIRFARDCGKTIEELMSQVTK